MFYDHIYTMHRSKKKKADIVYVLSGSSPISNMLLQNWICTWLDKKEEEEEEGGEEIEKKRRKFTAKLQKHIRLYCRLETSIHHYHLFEPLNRWWSSLKLIFFQPSRLVCQQNARVTLFFFSIYILTSSFYIIQC